MFLEFVKSEISNCSLDAESFLSYILAKSFCNRSLFVKQQSFMVHFFLIRYLPPECFELTKIPLISSKVRLF